MKSKIEIPSYLVNGELITIGKTFLYEVSVYKIWKDRAECHGSQYFQSNKPLKIKKKAKYLRRNSFTIAKFIDWITAPEEFIKTNNLKPIEKNVRTRRIKK